jgi:uncharacterized protein YuzB (UPF0349 family)
LADCDDNDVEEAGFDCVAVAEIGEEPLLGLVDGEVVFYD